MSTPQPLLILTPDDLLAERWRALSSSPIRATELSGLDTWRKAGHRLVVVDLGGYPPAAPPLWTRDAWQNNAADLAILATSSRPDDEEGLAALNAGACGYCHSHAPIDTLRQALEVIAGGELWVGRALLSRLLRLVDSRLPRAGLADWARPLTEREREVAHHAALGESNVAIADALGITERTVKAHLKAVFEKLQVADRLQLALRVHGVR
jgi:DNA-binding NarL/FixJ family response regulator